MFVDLRANQLQNEGLPGDATVGRFNSITHQTAGATATLVMFIYMATWLLLVRYVGTQWDHTPVLYGYISIFRLLNLAAWYWPWGHAFFAIDQAVNQCHGPSKYYQSASEMRPTQATD